MRRWRARQSSFVAALLAGVALAAAGWPAPAAATIDESQGTPGFCADDEGVTVVVDFQSLGGETIVRCAPGTEPRTGLEVLADAGFQVEGVQRWGSGFVCRIEDSPAAGESLPVEGDDGYREQCIDTPPASAYWGYWYADDGGDWQYSPYGVKNREVLPGGFEGWSFALNAPQGDPPAPRVAPQRPAGQPADDSDDPDGTSDPASESGPDGTPPPLPRAEGNGGGLSTRVGAVGDEPTEAPEWTGGEALPDVAQDEQGSPVPALLGLVAAAGLGAGAVVVATRRRRRRTGS